MTDQDSKAMEEDEKRERAMTEKGREYQVTLQSKIVKKSERDLQNSIQEARSLMQQKLKAN